MPAENAASQGPIMAEASSLDLPEKEKQLATAQKRISALEAEIARKNKYIRDSFEYFPAIICEIDLNWRLTYANATGLQLFGFSPEDVKNGMPVLQLFPPEILEDLKQRATKILSGDFGVLAEYPMHKKDGSALTMLIRTRPLVDDAGMPVGLQVCMLDITEQKKLALQLEKSEERFRQIFMKSPAAMALFVSAGPIFESNTLPSPIDIAYTNDGRF
jgi:PAS domain S-box-containing protein